jgi:hypothetical protein
VRTARGASGAEAPSVPGRLSIRGGFRVGRGGLRGDATPHTRSVPVSVAGKVVCEPPGRCTPPEWGTASDRLPAFEARLPTVAAIGFAAPPPASGPLGPGSWRLPVGSSERRSPARSSSSLAFRPFLRDVLTTVGIAAPGHDTAGAPSRAEPDCGSVWGRGPGRDLLAQATPVRSPYAPPMRFPRPRAPAAPPFPSIPLHGPDRFRGVATAFHSSVRAARPASSAWGSAFAVSTTWAVSSRWVSPVLFQPGALVGSRPLRSLAPPGRPAPGTVVESPPRPPAGPSRRGPGPSRDLPRHSGPPLSGGRAPPDVVARAAARGCVPFG